MAIFTYRYKCTNNRRDGKGKNKKPAMAAWKCFRILNSKKILLLPEKV
jgi:hypothetical protein